MVILRKSTPLGFWKHDYVIKEKLIFGHKIPSKREQTSELSLRQLAVLCLAFFYLCWHIDCVINQKQETVLGTTCSLYPG